MRAAVVIYQLGVLVTVLVKFIQPQSSTGWQEDDCRRTLRESLSLKVEALNPPKFSGHWTSYKCETRPGPEFVLRKYLFRRHSFNAQLYYYADETCANVTHSFTAKGTFRPVRASWRTPGAYEAKYRLSQVVAIPYTEEKAHFFKQKLHRYCKSAKNPSVKPYRKFKIFKFAKYSGKSPDVDTRDFDCLKVFDFTMNELQLVRVEKNHFNKFVRINNIMQSQANNRVELELLLGDISTNMKYRQQYRPTHYQIALKKSKTIGCNVCETISSSNQWQPPILQKENVTSAGVVGDWVSSRCETRPNGQYLTRMLSFHPDGRSWSGIYDFYKDPLCQEPNFSLDLKGHYGFFQRSKTIPTANEYMFRTLKLKVTARDFQMVKFLNSYDGKGCGIAKTWKIGVTRDVTLTGGCVTLGIELPNIEHEIMKAEVKGGNTFLYVGQRPSDFASLSVRKNIPTSFQPPLLKCGTNNQGSSSYNKTPIKHVVSGQRKSSRKGVRTKTFNPAPNAFTSTKNLTMYLVATNTGIHVQFDKCFVLLSYIIFVVMAFRNY